MLQRISYFNLIYATAYALIYFRDNTINSSLGILMIMLLNWLALRSTQRENYKWSIWHYLSGLWTLYYIGFLMYGSLNIFLSAIEYHFASDDTITYLALTSILCVTTLLQIFNYGLKLTKSIE